MGVGGGGGRFSHTATRRQAADCHTPFIAPQSGFCFCRRLAVAGGPTRLATPCSTSNCSSSCLRRRLSLIARLPRRAAVSSLPLWALPSRVKRASQCPQLASTVYLWNIVIMPRSRASACAGRFALQPPPPFANLILPMSSLISLPTLAVRESREQASKARRGQPKSRARTCLCRQAISSAARGPVKFASPHLPLLAFLSRNVCYSRNSQGRMTAHASLHTPVVASQHKAAQGCLESPVTRLASATNKEQGQRGQEEQRGDAQHGGPPHALN